MQTRNPKHRRKRIRPSNHQSSSGSGGRYHSPVLILLGVLLTLLTARCTPAQTAYASPNSLDSQTQSTSQKKYACAIQWNWEQNQVVITDVQLALRDGLLPGDIVTSINEQPVIQMLIDREEDFHDLRDSSERRATALEALLAENNVLFLEIQHGPLRYSYTLVPNCQIVETNGQLVNLNQGPVNSSFIPSII